MACGSSRENDSRGAERFIAQGFFFSFHRHTHFECARLLVDRRADPRHAAGEFFAGVGAKCDRLANLDVPRIFRPHTQDQPHPPQVGDREQHRRGADDFTDHDIRHDDRAGIRRSHGYQVGRHCLGQQFRDELDRNA